MEHEAKTIMAPEKRRIGSEKPKMSEQAMRPSAVNPPIRKKPPRKEKSLPQVKAVTVNPPKISRVKRAAMVITPG